MKNYQKVLFKKITILSGSIIGLVLLLFFVANNQTVVNFPDRGLEQVIREKIDKTDGSILLSEVRKISSLNASCLNISSLEGLEKLNRLEELNLESNQVKDLTPLQGLKKLYHLNLRNNNIIHLDSININALAGLPIRRLSLQHNTLKREDGIQFKLSDISLLSQLNHLEVLELRDNEISDLSPLVSLEKLEKLDLRDNQIEDITSLTKLINLEELNLRGNKINDLSALSNLKNLTYLNVHSNRDVKSLEPIEKLTGLQTLILRNVPVSNTIRFINDMVNLKRLNIANCEITDIGVLAALFSKGAFANEINRKEVEPNLNLTENKKIESNLNLSENAFNWESFDSLISVLNFKGDIDVQYPSWLPLQYKLAPVNYSHSGGFYSNAIDLTLTHKDSGVTIIYTLDGSEPEMKQVNSKDLYRRTYIYNKPINIKSRKGEVNLFSEIKTTGIVPGFISEWVPPLSEVFKSTVIRAKAVKTDRITSDIKTATFFVDENINSRYESLPVISLVGDYRDFFDAKTGIYVPGNNHKGITEQQNFYKSWKRKAHLEFFDVDRSKGFNDEYEISIQGLSSVAAPLKGISVVSDSNIGDSLIHYPIFSGTDFRSSKLALYKSFIVRGWGSAGNWPVFFNDAYNQRLVASTNLDIQAYKPVILFINGEYWGLHELREANKSSWYYQFHHGIDRVYPGFDIIKEWDVVQEGTVDHWNKLWTFIRSNDMSDDLNFERVSQMIDINNFIEYIIHCTYLGKRDWPVQNEAKWRPAELGGKWRFIQFDMDQGMNEWSNPKYDMFKHVINGSPPFESHKILVNLLNNQRFRNQFISTYADWMNTILSTQSELSLFNKMADELKPYVQEFQERWVRNYSWDAGLEIGRNIISERRDLRFQQLKSFFNLSELEIILDVSHHSNGYIRINTIDINDGTPGVPNNPYPWVGSYFTQIPLELEAVASEGYRFVGWGLLENSKDLKDSGNMEYKPSEPLIKLTLSENMTVKAIFEPLPKY